MTERVVALDRAGVLRLYATNGDGIREVVTMEVGELDEATAVMVAAALTDLRAVVNAKQPRPARGTHERVVEANPRTLRGLAEPLPRELPRGKRPRLGKRDRVDDDLAGSILSYLRANGPSTVPAIVEGINPEPTRRSPANKRVSNGLLHLKNVGAVERLPMDGSNRIGVWQLRATNGHGAE